MAQPPDDLHDLAVAIESAAAGLVGTWLAAADSAQTAVSAAQLRALSAVERRPGLSVAQLATELGTIPSWASRLCDRLEADGYVERRASSAGRRQLQLHLCRDGHRLLAAIHERRREALRAALAAMTAAERASLLAGLLAFDRTSGAGRRRQPPG